MNDTKREEHLTMTSLNEKAMPKRNPIFRGLLPIKKNELYKNAFAGFTLAIISIPEVMGYTKISGTPIITGIYTLLLPMLIFAIFGASNYLVVAADSATAAILAQSIIPLTPEGSKEYMSYVCILATIVGLLLVLCRLLRLGFISKFLSRTVLVGFLTGVGIQVALGQLSGICGISIASKGGALHKFINTLFSISKTNLYALMIAVFVTSLILLPKLFHTKIASFIRKIPWALLAIIISISLCYFFKLSAKGVPTVGSVPGGLPHFSIPSLSIHRVISLLPTAIIIVVVIITQSAATSTVYANRYNDVVDANTDLLGLGFANLIAGLSGTFVVNGSPTKTEIVSDAGGRSQIAHIFAVVVVTIVLLFLTGPLQYLPDSALSAIVLIIGIHLVDLKGMKRLYKKKRNEFYIALTTILIVIVVGAAQGIIFSMLLSLIEHLYRSYKPKNSILVPSYEESGSYFLNWLPLKSHVSQPNLVVYHFAASIYYANADSFADEIKGLVNRGFTKILLDFSAIADVDFTGGEVIAEVYEKLLKQNIYLGLVQVEAHVMNQLKRYGIIDMIDARNVFENIEMAIESIS